MKSFTSSLTNQRGYTLLELLLYVTILGSLLTTTVLFFTLMADASTKNQTISEVNDQGTAIMDGITQTIRNATSITTPAAAGSGASLTLVVPTGSLSPTVYSLSGTTLQIKEGAGAAVALSSNDLQVSNLTFTNLTRSGTKGIVQVSFTLARINPAGRNEYDYQKTFTSSAEVNW